MLTESVEAQEKPIKMEVGGIAFTALQPQQTALALAQTVYDLVNNRQTASSEWELRCRSNPAISVGRLEFVNGKLVSANDYINFSCSPPFVPDSPAEIVRLLRDALKRIGRYTSARCVPVSMDDEDEIYVVCGKYALLLSADDAGHIYTAQLIMNARQ
jgi:hypothetical protein